MIKKASIVNVETTIPKIVKSSERGVELEPGREIERGTHDGGLAGISRQSML